MSDERVELTYWIDEDQKDKLTVELPESYEEWFAGELEQIGIQFAYKNWRD